jgi:hypothetical protein
VGVALGLATGWIQMPMIRATNFEFLAFWTGIGMISGGVFAALLATLERNKTLAQLSGRRVAVWGMLGGATVPVLSTLLVLSVTDLHLAQEAGPVFVAMAAFGAACARATLWIARRGAEQPENKSPADQTRSLR